MIKSRLLFTFKKSLTPEFIEISHTMEVDVNVFLGKLEHSGL
jgi:hypothetical protein